MLVGVGGSGKQSVTRMACHMSETVFYQIEMIRGYNHLSFLENLKEIMLVAGVEGKPLAFCLVDTQIVDESFLEDVNNILNTGEVPNLFASEEYSKIREDLRPILKSQGIETGDGLQKAFVDRVRSNLHIIICHSPVGDALRVRCREFPSLINCTTIDWYNKWPKEALTSVAKQFLENEDLHTDEINVAMCDMCAELHWTVGVFGDKFFNELLFVLGLNALHLFQELLQIFKLRILLDEFFDVKSVVSGFWHLFVTEFNKLFGGLAILFL